MKPITIGAVGTASAEVTVDNLVGAIAGFEAIEFLIIFLNCDSFTFDML